MVHIAVMNDHDESDDVLKEGVSSALIPARERTLVRHLPFFAIVAEEGHFGRAAVRLGISQSALTRRVQALEKDIGVALFMRDQRTPQLTRAGEVLLEDTMEILHAVSASVRKARRAARGEIGYLRIAHTEQSLRVGPIKAALDAIRERFPGIKMEHTIMPSEAQIVALGKDELDLAFLYDVVLANGVRFEIDTAEIARFPAVLAMNRRHPLALKDEVRLADLNGVPMTWPSTRSGRSTGDALFAAFRSHGLFADRCPRSHERRHDVAHR